MDKFSQQKHRFQGLWGSLAARVMLVAMTFLVIPLFIDAITTLIHDYQVEMSDSFLSIKVLGASRARVLEQFNHLEYRFLDITNQLLEIKSTDEPEALDRLLGELKVEQGVSAIFLLDRINDNDWVCRLSSNLDMIGKNYRDFIDRLSLSQEHAATIRWDPDTQKSYYLVSKRIYSNESTVIQGMLNIAISSQVMLDRISIVKPENDPTDVSLLAPNGMVFISTDQDLVFSQFLMADGLQTPMRGVQAKEQISLLPLKLDVNGIRNNYEYEVNGQTSYGILVPVEGSDLQLLVSIPKKTLMNHFIQHMQQVALFFGIVVVFGGLTTWWLTRRMAKPFRELCNVMVKVKEGDLESRYRPHKMGFEINVVGDVFNDSIEALLEHMHEIENERVARETLARELQIGQEVQQSILPKQVPAFSNLDIASGYLSAKEVGGDFYDLYAMQYKEKDQLLCAVADTAGKGISACFYSLGLRSMLRSFSSVTENLGEMLQNTNNAFCHDTGESGIFVTAWVCVIDEQTKVMTFSSCGHPPGLLKRASGEVIKLSTPGIALGATHLDHVSTDQIQLQTDDTLLLYTDGVTEAHNQKRELYGEERLLTFIKNHPCKNAQRVIDDLLIDVGRFSTGEAQFDDLTALVIRIT